MMAIKSFERHTPKIEKSAYVDEMAVVIGDVEIGADSSVWPGAVIRGDINQIRIGEKTNIQDNGVIHVTHAGPYHPKGYITTIGNEVTVGHRVILHGCTILDQSLIGMGSIVMDGAVIESHVLLAAGSLVPPNKILESGYLWMGTPVKKIKKLTKENVEQIIYGANYYSQLKNRHLSFF